MVPCRPCLAAGAPGVVAGGGAPAGAVFGVFAGGVCPFGVGALGLLPCAPLAELPVVAPSGPVVDGVGGFCALAEDTAKPIAPAQLKIPAPITAIFRRLFINLA